MNTSKSLKKILRKYNKIITSPDKVSTKLITDNSPAINKIWITKDGRKVPVSEMTNKHIINTINLCRKNAINNYYDTFFSGLDFTGEIANSILDDVLANAGLDDYDEDGVESYLEANIKGYKWVKEEAIKRGIYEDI